MARRALVLKGSFEDSMGGSVVAALNRGRAASEAGWDVTVATTTDGHDSLQLLHESGLAAKLFPRRFPRGLSGSPGLLWWLLKHAHDYDVIEVHEIFALPTFYARLAAALYRVPFIIHPNNSLDPYDLRKHGAMKRLLGPLLRWLLKGSRGVWTASELEAERLVTFGTTVPRVVSPLPVKLPNACDLPPSDAPQHVLFLGRLDEKKGVERLIKALGLAQQRGARLSAVIAGSGDDDYAQALKDQANVELLPDTFSFPGHVVGTAREQLFMNASVFVLHSDNENFGIAVIEALGFGCPVILSPEVYIARELESRGAATVVAVDDLEGLAEAIARHVSLDAQDRHRLAEAARIVAADYDTEACVGRDSAIRSRLVQPRQG